MADQIIFGIRPIIEAIEAGKTLDKVFVKKGLSGDLSQELISKLRDHRVSFQFVPYQKLNRFTRKNHQGVVATLSPVEFWKLDDLLPRIFEKGEQPLLMILDGITDVRNFGAIVRSLECFGGHGVIIPEKGSASVSSDSLKTSAGALMNIPICKVSNLKAACRFLQSSGVSIIGMSEKGADELQDSTITGPVAVVLGSEDSGISNEIIQCCDSLLKIPISGKTASLNVSVSAGIALYEVRRQLLSM